MWLKLHLRGKGVGMINLLLSDRRNFSRRTNGGRTPEYLGKKIGAREMKLAMLAYWSSDPEFWTVGTLCGDQLGMKAVNNPGAHGLSQIVYQFSSSSANNGSAFDALGLLRLCSAIRIRLLRHSVEYRGGLVIHGGDSRRTTSPSLGITCTALPLTWSPGLNRSKDFLDYIANWSRYCGSRACLAQRSCFPCPLLCKRGPRNSRTAPSARARNPAHKISDRTYLPGAHQRCMMKSSRQHGAELDHKHDGIAH